MIPLRMSICQRCPHFDRFEYEQLNEELPKSHICTVTVANFVQRYGFSVNRPETLHIGVGDFIPDECIFSAEHAVLVEKSC